MQILAIRDRASRALYIAWARTMTDPTEQAAANWLALAAPLLGAAQSSAAGAALAYVGTYVALASDSTPVAATKPVSGFLEPRGVPLAELLMRPVVEMRSGLANKQRFVEAQAAGQVSAARIGATDPMLSYRAASSEAMQQNPRVTGYRRVPDSKACKFCLLVSTQRYHDNDLMPLHPNCGCTIAPIVGSVDPGRVLDRELLERLRGEGVLDDINRQRRSRAEREIGNDVRVNRDKAAHWRSEAEQATDPAQRRKYEIRAKDWDHKADVLEGTLPPVNIGAGKALIDEIFDKPKNFTAVHTHGELGPTLYEPGHHFAAA